jgi:hypothetical protein
MTPTDHQQMLSVEKHRSKTVDQDKITLRSQLKDQLCCQEDGVEEPINLAEKLDSVDYQEDVGLKLTYKGRFRESNRLN